MKTFRSLCLFYSCFILCTVQFVLTLSGSATLPETSVNWIKKGSLTEIPGNGISCSENEHLKLPVGLKVSLTVFPNPASYLMYIEIISPDNGRKPNKSVDQPGEVLCSETFTNEPLLHVELITLQRELIV